MYIILYKEYINLKFIGLRVFIDEIIKNGIKKHERIERNKTKSEKFYYIYFHENNKIKFKES